jgi:membrane-associated HD superfamily phosphohydrolase
LISVKNGEITPVAVSKPQEVGDPQITEIKEVYATYGRGEQLDSDQKTDQQQAEKVKKLYDAIENQKNAELALANVTSLVQQFETAQTLIESINKSPSVDFSPEEATKAQQIISEAYSKLGIQQQLSLPFQSGITNIKSQLKDARQRESNAKITFENAQKITSDAQKQLAKALFVSQRDALSVFGSFDNKTNTGTTTEVSFGKLFSTGVAAQNLSKAIERSTLRSSCIAALADIKNETFRQTLQKECINYSE